MSTEATCGDPWNFGVPSGGMAGQVLVAGEGISITGSTGWQSLELNLPENKEFKELSARMVEIEKRLAIVIPNEDLQARFPALQEAYDHYKLIEKLVNDQANKK